MSGDAPLYGRTRLGGAPARQNFQLGGTEDWARNFADSGAEEAWNQQNAFREFGNTSAARRNLIVNRGAPTTDFGAANQSFDAAGAASGAAGEASGAAGEAAGRQGDTYQGLRDFAAGPRGPSGAGAVLQQGANQSLRSNLAQARSGTGFGESAIGMAGAQRANVDAVAAAANQGAEIAAQEEQAYRNQQLQALGAAGELAGAQGQTELARGNLAMQQGDLALQQAQQETGQAQFLTESELEARRMAEEYGLAYLGQEFGALQAGNAADAAARDRELRTQESALQGSMGLEETKLGLYQTEIQRQMAEEQIAMQREQFAVQAVSGAIGGAMGGAMMSDERAKKNKRLTDLRQRYADLS